MSRRRLLVLKKLLQAGQVKGDRKVIAPGKHDKSMEIRYQEVPPKASVVVLDRLSRHDKWPMSKNKLARIAKWFG